MNNIDISTCALDIDYRLIPNRIGIALFSYGLNEFYNAFRYLKSVLLFVFSKNDLSKPTIKAAMLAAAKYHNLTDKSIVTSLSKLYEKLHKDFFTSSPLYSKIKMNCYHKTQFIAEKVLKDIQISR